MVQENLEEMRAATPRAQRLSEKVYGRHANDRVELLRAALRWVQASADPMSWALLLVTMHCIGCGPPHSELISVRIG